LSMASWSGASVLRQPELDKWASCLRSAVISAEWG
jgi:hypothetical protein